jgi:hypothetical protein
MISVPRVLLQTIALLFGCYFGILGLLNLENYSDQFPVILSTGLYFITLLLIVTTSSTLEMPSWVAYFALACSALISLLLVGVIEFATLDGYLTWYVGGIGLLMSITAIRSHRLIAILGMAIMSTLTVAWGGIGAIFTTGLIGSWLWLAVGIGSSFGIQSSEKAALNFYQKAMETSRLIEASSAARKERQERIETTLKGSLPILTKIWKQNGELTPAQKRSARLLEAELRDEIRGRGLISKEVVAAVRQARRKGVEVQLLDDGGLNGATDLERKKILRRIASEVANIRSGKLVIRAAPAESWRITIVAIQKKSDTPDLFLKL